GEDFLRWAAQTPWKRGQTPLSLAPNYEDSAFKLYFENYDYNEFWKQPGLGMDEYLDSFPKVPVLSVVGWYEVYPRAIIDGRQKMVARKFPSQCLLARHLPHAISNPSCGEDKFRSAADKVTCGGHCR